MVLVIEGKIIWKWSEEKQKLVLLRVSTRFKSVERVRVMGVDVYMYISFKRFLSYSAFSGPAQGEELRGGGAGPRHSWKKFNKYTISNKTNLWWNKNIRLTNLAEASNIWLVRLDPISSVASLKTNIFTKLLSVVDLCVFTSQVMWYMYKQWSLYFIKVLKTPRNYDFLKQIEREDISVTTSAEHDKCPDLQTSPGKSCNHRSRRRFFSAARRLKTWFRSTMTKERF